jgi:hypothetical protein
MSTCARMRGSDLAQRVDQAGPAIVALDSPAHRSVGGAEVLLPKNPRPSIVKGILKIGIHAFYLPLRVFNPSAEPLRR